ncbi:MAG TPA: tetratricopeptide repeat-containing glycosyltransferase family protein [Gemmataceae bacterium]|nr:tetratricopeptide repeat-containing glycosyltransferase family protein [Gemmataceae bacterium]
MPTTAELFALAQRHQQAGGIAQSEQICRQILMADQRHLGAWRMLATACQARADLEGAQNAWQSALALYPDDAEAHSHLANVLIYQNKIDDAIAHYRQALRLNPDIFAAQYILGIALHGKTLVDEAMAHYREALRLNPHFADTHHRMGLALADLGRLTEATACYRRALQLDPNLADAWNNLGIALDLQGQLDEATLCFQKALQLKPSCGQAFINWGLTLERLGKVDEALQCMHKALQLNPNDPSPSIHLGNFHKRQNDLDEAVKCYQQALQLAPGDFRTRVNLGHVYQEQSRFEQALACYDEAMRGNESEPGPHHNRALLWLLLGNWTQGWPEYEWRWQTPGFERLSFTQPRWDGTPLNGRTVLVLPEQGLGDTLQFIRYVPLVQQRGGRVLLGCTPRMAPLLRDCFGLTELAIQGGPFPQFDTYVPLQSLPGIMGTTPANVPGGVPYIRAHADLVAHWRQQLEPMKGFKIGIAWQGNPEYQYDRQRSITLACFARLAAIPGVQLVSLQKGPGTDQLASLAGRCAVRDLGGTLDERAGAFMDTAAVMMNLDLVITSDTAGAHLAGALGVPVWVALPMVPDWRWLLQREDSPWYPTMRLFRQQRRGDWQDVFERIASALQNVVS